MREKILKNQNWEKNTLVQKLLKKKATGLGLVLMTMCGGGLSGCATTDPTLGKDGGPTMKDIYDQKFHTQKGLGRNDVQRELKDRDEGLTGDTVVRFKKVYQDFQFLPNPILTMYVYPHLSRGGTPVPGYSTYFKFYKQDHVAEPSEIIQYPSSDSQQR